MSNLPADDLAFHRWLSARLDPFKSVEPNDPDHLFVPIHEGTDHDQVSVIHREITISDSGSLNFISGFSGSGKSSELRRLKSLLEGQGYLVAMADASDYFLPTLPVSRDMFLIKMAGAYSDQLENLIGLEALKQSYWQRLIHWLKETHVQLQGFDLDTDAGNFKVILKENPSFISQLEAHLSTLPKVIEKQVHNFFADATSAAMSKLGATYRPVFILDSFEKLQDISQDGGEVADSIMAILANHKEALRVPGHHVVLTMPPWIKLLSPGPGNVRLVYGVKLWTSDTKRPTYHPGMKLMREVALRRFTQAGLDRFFGPTKGNKPHPLLDKLIKASGGHLRDFILLLRETMLRATLPRSEPDAPLVTSRQVNSAIANHQNSFGVLSDTALELLIRISHDRACRYPDGKNETRHTLNNLFNNRYAFFLTNAVEWCDVHPLLWEITKLPDQPDSTVSGFTPSS
ncbi:MAG: hypothetical protein JNJ83_24180 [Verrucomicrobiaceae bacterium]|nr:hypothetical protein [Verrucomicrobiaceae bacterium]